MFETLFDCNANKIVLNLLRFCIIFIEHKRHHPKVILLLTKTLHFNTQLSTWVTFSIILDAQKQSKVTMYSIHISIQNCLDWR